MVVGVTSGNSTTAVGCGQNTACRAGMAKPAANARIEPVNLAAGALPRQIVSDAMARGNQEKR
jgi:hypothetical protein